MKPQYFEETDAFREGRARVRLKQEKRYGYIDLSGTIAIKPRFTSASVYFSEGLASVKEKEDRLSYSKGRSSVNLDQMAPHGFIDLDGNMVIEPRFFSTLSFQGGLCLVETEKTIAYINKKGEYVWEGLYVEYGIVL